MIHTTMKSNGCSLMHVILIRTVVITSGINQFLTHPRTYIGESEVIIGPHLNSYKCMNA